MEPFTDNVTHINIDGGDTICAVNGCEFIAGRTIRWLSHKSARITKVFVIPWLYREPPTASVKCVKQEVLFCGNGRQGEVRNCGATLTFFLMVPKAVDVSVANYHALLK